MSNILARQLNKFKWVLRNYRLITKDARLIKDIRNLNYDSDGLMSFNNCDCLVEPRFANAYNRSLQVNDWRGTDGKKFDMRWRYYIVCSMADHVKHLEGDFVECGVYKGGYSIVPPAHVKFFPVGSPPIIYL